MTCYDTPREVFVIVVEVDHLRARAAYRKGMDDLQEIWPAVMEFAESLDAAQLKRIQALEAKLKQEQEAYKTALRQYNKDFAKWELSVFKGAPPLKPYDPTVYYDSSWDLGVSYKRSYESTMTSLKSKLDLAEAAQGPFKMTEHDVAAMIAWENGTRVADIKKTVGLTT